jgi:hypothetical protein
LITNKLSRQVRPDHIRDLPEVHRSKFSPNNGWTEWIESIRTSTIVYLREDDKWIENSTSLIQVKRMSKNSISSSTENLDQYDLHPFESYLDVIKLPKDIPKALSDLPNFLFIRPDEYCIVRCLLDSTRTASNDKAGLIIGNPGISKSWLQYKIILFAFRQELFNKLSAPFIRKTIIERPKEKTNKRLKTGSAELTKSGEEQKKHVSAVEEYNDTIQGYSDEDNLHESPVNNKTGSCPVVVHDQRKITEKDPLWWPKIIIRTVAGTKSLFFYLEEIMPTVFEVDDHKLNNLDIFTNPDTMLLWEPGCKLKRKFLTMILKAASWQRCRLKLIDTRTLGRK